MRADQTILFSDLDGTLFTSRSEVAPEDRAAIERYVAAGGLFAISSGRAPYNARQFLPGVPVNAPSVVFNGAGAYDYGTGEYLFCELLDRAAFDAALARVRAEIPCFDLQVYTENEILYCTPEETAQPELLRLHRPCRFVGFDGIAGETIVKCLLYAPGAYDAALCAILHRAAEGRFVCLEASLSKGSPLHYYELMPLGTNKGAALHALRTHPRLAGRTVLAAGDYRNDLELLREADVPIAPDNALDEVKAIARYVTVSNDEHAVAHILSDILPAL